MQHKVSELEGALLDFAVARAERHLTQWRNDEDVVGRAIHTNDSIGAPLGRIGEGEQRYAPSTDWAQGGPIIERERINVVFDSEGWCAGIGEGLDLGGDVVLKNRHWTASGPTPLIAGMRAYVASKLGDTVDLP